jgi:2-(1,2-epoxy-1,2-dihydrophenyl)acetyl-CoA isomerase
MLHRARIQFDAMTSERVQLNVEGAVGFLRLVRPDAGNAIDPLWVEEFHRAVFACAADQGLRAVLITAAGPAFSVGGDLKHFAARSADLDVALGEMVPAFQEALGQLARLPVPVVAAVHGPVAGGGIGIAYCADIVLVAPAARFVCGFSKLGLSGDGGGSWWLPRIVGPKRAAELMFENRQLTAEEAVELGIATRVVDGGELEAEAHRVAERLAGGPPTALAHMRALLCGSGTATLDQHLAAETAAMIECGATDDAREGVLAFSQRRAPNFGPALQSTSTRLLGNP